METPAFRLGLVGFDAREERMLGETANRYKGVHWHCGRPDGADAWVVNGARVGRIQGAAVRVVASHAAGDGAGLVLDFGSRPTLVATPAPQALEQLTRLRFALGDADSFAACLADVDRRLAGLRRLYWVAAHLVKCKEMVGKAVYELRLGPELLAVADMKGTVSILPFLREAQIDQAVWKHRVRKTVEVPADFERYSLAEVLWTYTTRTRLNLLPDHYAEVPIYLRRPPRVPTERIDDVHLRVVRELAIGPSQFVDLMDRTEADAQTLSRALAALYYVGSITSNPDRAWAGSQSSSHWASRTSVMEQGASTFRARAEGYPSTTPLG